jgi:hypothetical protein
VSSIRSVASGVTQGEAVKALVHTHRIDRRTHEEMVRGAGYPYHAYDVVTGMLHGDMFDGLQVLIVLHLLTVGVGLIGARSLLPRQRTGTL